MTLDSTPLGPRNTTVPVTVATSVRSRAQWRGCDLLHVRADGRDGHELTEHTHSLELVVTRDARWSATRFPPRLGTH